MSNKLAKDSVTTGVTVIDSSITTHLVDRTLTSIFFFSLVSSILMQSLVRGVQRREAAARLSLVEAFYGDETSGDNIAHVHAAAEHSCYAIRAAALAPDQAPLFDWLGIRLRSNSSAESEGAEGPSSQAPTFGNRVMPVARSARVSEDVARPLPSPATIWGPRPPRRFTPPSATFPPTVLTRKVSEVSSFGSQQLGDVVFTWLAGCEGRQRRLSRQMVSSVVGCFSLAFA